MNEFGQFDESVEDRGLLGLRAAFTGGCHLLRDGVTLTHR